MAHTWKAIICLLITVMVATTVAIKPVRKLRSPRFLSKGSPQPPAEYNADASTETDVADAANTGQSSAEEISNADAAVTAAEAGETTEAVKSCEFRARRPWRSLLHEEKLHFLNAVKELKAAQLREDEDKSMYETFVDKYERTYDAVHSNSWFLPFNRAFLLQFENALLSTPTGKKHCVTIPFWDYAKDFANETELHTEFFTEEYFGELNDGCFTGTGIPNFSDQNECVKRNPSPRFKVPGPAQLQKYMSDYPNYGAHTGGFRRAIESIPHAMPRLFIGGTVTTKRAVADPFAWLILSAVDAWWSTWQRCHEYHKVPNLQLNEVIYMHTDDGTRPDVPLPEFHHHTARSVHSTDDLGYGYVLDHFLLSVEFDAICPWKGADSETAVKGPNAKGGSDGSDSASVRSEELDGEEGNASSVGVISHIADSDDDTVATDDDTVATDDDTDATDSDNTSAIDSDSDQDIAEESNDAATIIAENTADIDADTVDVDADADTEADSDAANVPTEIWLIETKAKSRARIPISLVATNKCFQEVQNTDGPNNDSDALANAVSCECKIAGDHAIWPKTYFESNNMIVDYSQGSDEVDYCRQYQKKIKAADEQGQIAPREFVEEHPLPEPFVPSIVPAPMLD